MQPLPIHVNVRADRLTPPLTPEAVAYAWEQLLQRAGFASLNVPLWYADPADVPPDLTGVVVIPCPPNSFEALLRRAPGSLPSLPLEQALPQGVRVPVIDPLPILFWGAGGGMKRPFAALREKEVLILYVDIIAATFFMLSRWEETVILIRDEHGRFPATASVAYKQGFLDRPIVDEYAMILREWMKILLPGWQPRKRRFSIKISHDVDKALSFPKWQVAIRVLGGDLLKRRSLSRAGRDLLRMIIQMTTPSRDPYFQSLLALARISEETGLSTDAFYFMTALRAPYDDGYDPASQPISSLISDLRSRGFEIGLHAGYHTFNNPERLVIEKARLERLLGDGHFGGRQHYLRFRVPDTWRHWERVGLVYDSTMGYADHEGFRCGTCHLFRPFDIEQNRELDLLEYPLIVMDDTLRSYRRMTPKQSEKRILELARRCRQVEGTFTLLWHNTCLMSEPWINIYCQIIRKLFDMQE